MVCLTVVVDGVAGVRGIEEGKEVFAVVTVVVVGGVRLPLDIGGTEVEDKKED